jgi:putative SOS response-associated peptidase YedK
LDALRWGLIPRWADDPSIGSRMMNARSESIAEKPSFREAFVKRRAIAFADGFYEWQRLAEGPKAPKQAFAVAMADGTPMPLAALWEGWRGKDGEIIRSYTIITTNAAPELSPLHDRMPVILPPEDWDEWLGETPAEPARFKAMLRPFPRAGLAVWPVSARVNRVAEDDAALLERDPLAQPPPGLDDPALW